ncbi:MAG: COG3650 family protein [Gemmatimonadaceae bacterium]
MLASSARRLCCIAVVTLTAACGGSEAPRPADSSVGVSVDTLRGSGAALAITQPLRAIGTEPFWALDVDSTGLRFTSPDDTGGIRFPPIAHSVAGDTMVWVAETERAAIDVRIWRDKCSDGMSDRVWPYVAVVRIEGKTHRGCADARPETSTPVSPIGTWAVVDHRIPGVAAMTDPEAARWHGRVVSFTATQAISQSDTCHQAAYRYRSVPTDSLLRDFRLAPADLGLEGRPKLGVTEVLCSGVRWSAAGGLLLWLDTTRTYTIWDGVVFGLRRSR